MAVGLADDYRHAVLDDAGLLACNEGKRVAEELLVVERDVGDDAEVGADDVGAIQTASQADLHDSHIDLLLSEILEREGGCELEE